MGSGYLLGSGTSRFRDPQVLGARKVPGTLGFRQGSGNLTMVSSGSGITGTPIYKHPGNPEFGERGFRQGSSNTGFRQGSENHRGCGPTVWIYFLDYATGSGQGQGCGTTIFKKPSPGSREPGFWQGSEVPETTQGSDIRRGLYQGSCYGQGPRKPICKETKVPGPKGPGQRAIADRGGHSVTINQRVSVPQTQGSNIRCGLCQGSGNEGSRKTRFQEHKGFRKSPSQSWVLCGGFRTCRFMFVCSVGAQRRSTDLF